MSAIITVGSLIVGYILGLHLAFVFELIIAAIGIWYLTTWHSRQKEIGALQDIAIVMLLIIGMFIGDFVVFFYFEEHSLKDVFQMEFIRNFFIPVEHQ